MRRRWRLSTPPARRRRLAMAELVADASALVDVLLGNAVGRKVGHRFAGHVLHTPAHVDAEVLSALGRLHRAGDLPEDDVEAKLAALVAAPLVRHPVHDLLFGAWARRHQLRLADALYVELANAQGWTLVTTDRRLRAVPVAEVVDP
jgi:predicted nucleic acid-binding protein